MDKFEIGEIAIAVCVSDELTHKGECEIISHEYAWEGDNALVGYECKFPCGVEVHTNTENLRKRRQPTELSTWEEVEADMGWNPTKQSVTNRNNVAICNEGE